MKSILFDRRRFYSRLPSCLSRLTLAVSSVTLATAILAQHPNLTFTSPEPGLLIMQESGRTVSGHAILALEPSKATDDIPLLLFVGDSCERNFNASKIAS